MTARLAWRAALIVAIAVAAAGWLAVREVRATLERGTRSDVAAASATATGRLAALGAAVETALATVDDRLRGDAGPVLAAALTGSPPRDAAAGLARAAGLDRIEIVADDGAIVLATSDRIGLVDPSVAELPAGRAVLTAAAGPAGPEWRIVTARELAIGRRRLLLVGQRTVRAADLAGPGAVWLIGSGDGPSLAAAPPGAPATSAAAAAPDGTTVGGWRVAAAGLPLPGAARLLVGVDAAPAAAALDRLVRRLALVLAAATLLSGLAAAWAARGVARRLDTLVRAVQAVTAGEADYALPTSRQDVVDDLAASFSEMRRAAERERVRSVRAERVAAWRDVARRVAHEVKNPLVPIRLTIQNLVRARRDAPDRFDALLADGARTILEEVDQLSRMVGEFSEFARLPLPVPAPLDLGVTVNAVVELFGAEPGVAVVRVGAAGAGPEIVADADQIARALKNVVGNAVDACRQRGGRVAVEVWHDPDHATIEVRDDGPGFPPDAVEQLFEPFFTTKDGGTGLGLAITSRIVAEHGGEIAARAGEGGGAVVTIRLPREPLEDG